nr:hypothetical protein [uncultured Methylotenera sp.]
MKIYVLFLSLLFVTLNSFAAPPASLPDGHPLVGTWTFALPNSDCSETYNLHGDGTGFVTSGEEVGESIFEISENPSEKGFYKWVDIISKDNGKRDCMGGVMEIGHEAVSYVLLHPTREMILVCQDESLKACFGPLKRVHGNRS